MKKKIFSHPTHNRSISLYPPPPKQYTMSRGLMLLAVCCTVFGEEFGSIGEFIAKHGSDGKAVFTLEVTGGRLAVMKGEDMFSRAKVVLAGEGSGVSSIQWHLCGKVLKNVQENCQMGSGDQVIKGPPIIQTFVKPDVFYGGFGGFGGGWGGGFGGGFGSNTPQFSMTTTHNVLTCEPSSFLTSSGQWDMTLKTLKSDTSAASAHTVMLPVNVKTGKCISDLTAGEGRVLGTPPYGCTSVVIKVIATNGASC